MKKTKRYSDVQHIEQRLKEECPAPGEYLYDYKVEQLKKEAKALNTLDL